MKQSTKSFGLRLAGALQDAGRTTVRAAMTIAPLPGLDEVKEAARKLVDGIQAIETHQTKRANLSRRIAATVSLLESHLNGHTPCLELQYFFNKMVICHQKLLEIQSKREISKALRVTQELEMMEMLEREISSDFQDAIFALILQRLPPCPAPEIRPSTPPVVTITEPVLDQSVVFPSPEPFHNYPKVTRCEISLSTLVRRSRSRSEPASPLVKSIALGEYKGRSVLVVQYSSRSRQENILTEFLDDVSGVIQERHPNVVEFIGVSDDLILGQTHFMVFDAGRMASRDAFLRSAHTAEQTFTFLEGVKSGMQCLLDHGVQTWHEIYASDDGRAVIHPPYWEEDRSWDKSNHDVFSSLTGITQSSDFPLSTLAEILNISGSNWKSFQSAVLSHTRTAIRDYHLMHIASQLNLPIPPFLLTYYGALPSFILAVGSIGIPGYEVEDSFHGSMSGWTTASSLWSCAGWEALHTHALDYWIAPGRDQTNEDGMEMVGMSESILVDPLETSSDGWLSYGYFDSETSFGVGYEMAISETELFEMSWDRFCTTRLNGLLHLAEERQDFHAVKHASITVHCQPGSIHGLLPLFFHRRPSSLFNAEHYWGFFSDNPDPTAAPCRMVKSMAVNYVIEINTSRASDSWVYRGDKCLDLVIAKTPGIFEL